MARWLAIAIVIAQATNADADATVRLASSGDRCSVETLPARVAGVLGRDPFDPTAPAVIRVQVDAAGDHVVARVTFEEGDRRRGPRTVEAADCNALLDSIALVIALGVSAAVDRTEASTAAATPPPQAPAPALELHDATAAIDEVRSSSELAASVGGAAGFSSNGWRQLLALGLRWRAGHHALAFELRRGAPEHRAVLPSGNVDITTTTASGVACRMVGDVGLCGVVTAGVIHAEPTGLLDARSVATPVMGLGGRVGVEHELWRALRARVELGVDGQVTTSRIDVDHMPVWASSTFQVWAGAGVLARFL